LAQARTPAPHAAKKQIQRSKSSPIARIMWSPTAWIPSDEVTLPMRVEFVRHPLAPASGDPFDGALPMKVELPYRPCAPGWDAGGGGGALDGALPLKVKPFVASCETSGSASDTQDTKDVDTDEDAVSGSWSSADDSSPASPLLVSLACALKTTPAARTRLRSQATMYVPAADPFQVEHRFAPKHDSKGRAAVMPPDGERTTVMMCNLPSSYTSDKLVVFLDLHGFSEHFDLVYVPINFKSMSCVGYSFVNFTTHEHATEFMLAFEGFDDWGSPSKGPCTVCWSDVQGLNRNLCHYQNSPVMCESVPEFFKPILLNDGEKISFPKPTKKLRALKCRRSIVERH